MSHKSAKIEEMLREVKPGPWPLHYAGFFHFFNAGLYYESHDVLEEMWLPVRKVPEGDFFKGLIQIAGAFVHMQKGRIRPARALLKSGLLLVRKYPAGHLGVDQQWLEQLQRHWSSLLEGPQEVLSRSLIEDPPQWLLSEKSSS